MDILIAKTHPSEYLIHKYWARKPHNVVSAFISKYAKRNHTVLDPFCGSCVTNVEAVKLGYDTIGVDINPIATLIGSVSLTRIDKGKFCDLFYELKANYTEALEKFWMIKRNIIRYCLHELILKCSECGNIFHCSEDKRKGKKYKCNICKNLMNANVSTIHSTRVTAIMMSDKRLIKDVEYLKLQSDLANKDLSGELGTDSSKYDYNFLENKRILSYKSTTTSSFFTPRNFSILSYMADQIHGIKERQYRNIFLLCLTSSVAQCSRLIPNRNNLTTGGPAWSVPGFWIPKKHLECNPLQHFVTRFKKVLNGLFILNAKYNGNAKHQFFNSDIVKCANKLKNKKIGYVFADPPYGDSVPYLEFSILWNSWLKKQPDIENEIIVSNSNERDKTWEKYSSEIIKAVETVSANIKDGTFFTFTFNQLFLEAWNALLTCSENAGLLFHDVTLVLPAVIPSKARFSVKGSYIGDYYITFIKSSKIKYYNVSEENYFDKLTEKFRQIASTRNGIISYPHIIRVAIGTILKEKYPAHYTNYADEYIKSNFTGEKGAYYYNGDFVKRVPIINEIEMSIKKTLKEGPKTLWELSKIILDEYDFVIAPEIYEIMKGLENVAIKRSKKYHLKSVSQLSLF